MKNNGTKEAKNKKKGKKKKRRILKRILLTILIIIVAIAGYIYYKTQKNGGGMKGFLSTIVGNDENTLENLDPLYCLLVGQSQNMTDTIIVAKYDPKTQYVAMLSIPRDTFVGKSKKRVSAYDKINALYQGEYPEKTLEAVNDITGLNIQNYVFIDTKALRELVDAIGGVYFDVPIDMDYDDVTQKLYIHLKKGYQKLNGEQAEGLVRYRHSNPDRYGRMTSYPSEYGDNDLGRMRTQREFIAAVMKQTLKPGNIVNVGKILDIAYKNVETNMDLSYIKKYIPYAVEINTDEIKTDTLPGEPEKINGIWFYTQNSSQEKEAAELVNQMFLEISDNDATKENENTEETIDKKASEIRIEVLNGSTSKSNLTKVTDELKNKGYNVVKTGVTATTSKTKIINKTNNSSNSSSKIKAILGVGTITTETQSGNIDYTIIIGKDFK